MLLALLHLATFLAQGHAPALAGKLASAITPPGWKAYKRDHPTQPNIHPFHSTPQVKEVRLDPEGQRSSEAELAQVRQDADTKRAALEQWCITSYGEVSGMEGWGGHWQCAGWQQLGWSIWGVTVGRLFEPHMC